MGEDVNGLIVSCYGAGGQKKSTQRGHMTSGRYQLFDKNDPSAETRGSRNMCSRPSRRRPMDPNGAITYGRPGENQEVQKKQ